ncbi:hypothetical protein XA68_18344 [Ophiocordyceps unilateralis]|uniref:Uncharacterized protein n=1 Tax=Ophiocordyceps unilateralis TaxID=268505 RepID=A0A2A9P1E7_OPHUN|nr:hypothetical protein XA68_18344 [Ophiocordyceps unilateralis]
MATQPTCKPDRQEASSLILPLLFLLIFSPSPASFFPASSHQPLLLEHVSGRSSSAMGKPLFLSPPLPPLEAARVGSSLCRYRTGAQWQAAMARIGDLGGLEADQGRIVQAA